MRRGATFGWLVALGLASTLLVWFAVVEKRPARSLATLVAVLGPLPGGGALAGIRAQARRGATPIPVGDWPVAALSIAAATVAPTPLRDGIRLQAAVDIYRGQSLAAIERLQDALRWWPRDPVLLNDLAAAHIAAAADNQESSALHLSQALEHAQLALDLRPAWPEPKSNRAAALDVLGIGVAWKRSNPGQTKALTAGDVASLDEAAGSALVKARPQAVRELIEGPLLEAWAERVLRGDPGADRYLSAFTTLALARRTTFGDNLYADTSEAIAHARGLRRRSLAQGHVAYGRGRTLYDAGQREAAQQQFERARTILAQHESPFRNEADLHYLIGLYQQRRTGEVIEGAERLRQIARSSGHRTVAARSSWILALALMQSGRIGESVASHEAARREYTALGEHENAASVANSAADTLRITGDWVRGWQVLGDAVRSFDSLTTPQRQYLLLFNLSLYAQDDGILRAAEIYQTAALEAADRRGVALTMVESRLRRAQLLVRRGRLHAADQDLSSASRLLAQVDSPVSHAYLSVWLDRLRLLTSEPRDAGAASLGLEALVERFRRTEPAEIPSLYLEASRAARLARDSARARELVRRGIEFMRERRALLVAPEYRLMHFSATWELSHDLIALELEQNPVAALIAADAGRSALIVPFSKPEPPPLDLSRLAVPPDRTILYYSVLKDRVVVWAITGGGVKVRELEYDSDVLGADIKAYVRALQTDAAAEATQRGHRLFSRLVAPALGDTRNVRRLLVSSDGALTDLPFSALTDAQGKPLVESFEITYAPALAVLSENSYRRPESVAAIGYNGAPNADLPRLQAAESEATAVSGMYPNGAALIGIAATPEKVGAAVAGRDALHIAAHAVANRLAPWNSQLRLAAEGAGSSGVVTAEAIAGWDLARCQLVVLSACETASGSRVRGLGVISMTWPFLSAGARTVVGTLWRIDDRGSEPFMREFHRQILDGRQPSEALRQSQLQALRSADPNLNRSSVWSAWIVQTRAIKAE